MKTVTAAFCFFLFAASAAHGQVNLCDTFVVQKYEPIAVSIAPGRYTTGYAVKVNDINYRVTINKMNKVEFAATGDTAFSADLVAVGTTYGAIPKKMIVSERPIAGWGYVVELKSGWTAVFDDAVVYKSLKAERNSKIGWFYKNNDCTIYYPVSE